jgi:indolepyruvate decarboxylase
VFGVWPILGASDPKEISVTNATVAEYAVGRLVELGIGHVFGLPGDFSFPFDDAIEANEDLTWILSSNELNAAYSADGYARIHGAAMLTTTYAVGELSALNGVMGSKAERVPVFHLVGSPSVRLVRSRKSIHHSFGDGTSGQFQDLSAASACVSAYLTPENTISEMERVILEAMRQRQPAYITVPQDYALMPVIGDPVVGVPLADTPTATSEPRELAAALEAITSRLAAAGSVAALVAFTVARHGLQASVRSFLDATGIPFATTGMDKGVLSETHPLYLGMYTGDSSTTQVRDIVEHADLVLNLGGALFSDFSTSEFSTLVYDAQVITIWDDHVEVGTAGEQSRTYGPVRMQDVLTALTAHATRRPATSFSPPQPIALVGAPDEPPTHASVNSRLQQFLEPRDVLVVETGIASFTLTAVLLPEDAEYHNQTLWGSIGWATPAALGAALADRSRRVVLVTGDGSHQLTATEIGVMGRYGVTPVILVLNNGIFGIEEYLESNEVREYNNLAPWKYATLPAAMGCHDWFCTTVTTNEELDAALNTAQDRSSAAYIEIVMDPSLVAPASAEKLGAGYETAPGDGT